MTNESALSIPHGVEISHLRSAILVVFMVVLLAGGWPRATAAPGAVPGEPVSSLQRFRVFRLHRIAAEKAAQYLSELSIGTASKLPGAEMLVVTGEPATLVKAAAVLSVVDACEPYAVRVVDKVGWPRGTSILDVLGDRFRGLDFGTLAEPPADTGRPRAIVDVHDGRMIALAPQSKVDQIVTVIEQPAAAGNAPAANETAVAGPNAVAVSTAAQLPESAARGAAEPADATAAGPQAAPADTNETSEDELFGRLLERLEQAEKRPSVSEERQPEVGLPEAAPEQAAAPNQPPASPAGEVSPPPVTAGTTAQPSPAPATEVDAILERLKAIENALKTLHVPGKGEVPEQPAAVEPVAKIEHPNEVNEVNVPGAESAKLGPEEIPGADELLKVDLPEKLPIEVFLGFVGEHLGLDYIYDPAKVKGEVTLRLHGKLRGTIRKRDLYDMLESVMQFYGYVMTRKDNLVTIRPINEAEVSDPVFIHPGQQKLKTGDVVVTKVFQLEHIDTTSAKNLLEGMKLGIAIKEIDAAGKLIVTGYAYRMPRIKTLLEMVDQPGQPKQFRYRQLKYTMAETLAPKVKALVEQLGEVTVTIAKPAKAPAKPTPTPSSRIRRPPVRRPTPTPTQAAKPQPAQPGVYLDYDERTNRILMIGFADQLDTVEELIDSLDTQQQDLRSLRLYEIQYIDAEEVRNKLQELGIISAATTTRTTGRGRITSRTARTAPPRPGTPKTGAATHATTTTAEAQTAEERLAGEPQVVVLETINSLLVNATDEQHLQIATIIGYVDSETRTTDIPYVVYQLENQDPEQLAEVLNKLIQETTQQKDKEGKIVSTTTTKRVEEDIIIISDPSTYSLIVYASKKNQQWISSLIKQLDQYRPQVLLDVTLVEVTKNDEFTMDLDLVSKFPKLGAGGEMDMLSPLLSPFPSKRITEAAVTHGAGGEAFYADRHIQALLSVMQKKNYGRILAKPKLLVNDNQEGTITTEEKTAIVREKTDVIPGSAATAPTATTSVAFETFTAGITLTITPHISQGDQLQLKITMQRTDFRLKPDYTITTGTGTKSGPTPPDLLTSNVDTTVTVPNGKTIILGGLEKLNQGKGGTKVPLLGDLPLIGGLFRNTANTDNQSRLYVFVKAHILRPGEQATGVSDIELVSRENKDRFEKYEAEMQKYQDWPGFKPKPFEPVRVLESR